MFVVYDESGLITQTISGPDKTYGLLLDKSNYKWLFLEGATTLDVRFNYVDTIEKTVKPCAAMTLTADKYSISADGLETSIITGIPTNSRVQIYCNEAPHVSEVVNDGTIEFCTDTAATYKIGVSCQKYIYAELVLTAK